MAAITTSVTVGHRARMTAGATTAMAITTMEPTPATTHADTGRARLRLPTHQHAAMVGQMSLRVLIIDDDHKLRALLADYLAPHDVQVVGAASGARSL